MALALDFSVCQEGCDSLTFTEKTGVYSADNTGGWGTPNPAVSDATAATLTISSTSGTVLYTIDLSSNFPNQATDFEYEITFSDDLDDGVFIMTYTVTVDDGISETDYTKSCYVFLHCQADCCVKKLFAKVTKDCDSCDKEALQNALTAFGLLEGAKSNASCGNITEATKLLKAVQYLCSYKNCKCNE